MMLALVRRRPPELIKKPVPTRRDTSPSSSSWTALMRTTFSSLVVKTSTIRRCRARASSTGSAISTLPVQSRTPARMPAIRRIPA